MNIQLLNHYNQIIQNIIDNVSIISKKNIILLFKISVVYTILYLVGTYDKYSGFDILDPNVRIFYLPEIITFVSDYYLKNHKFNNIELITKRIRRTIWFCVFVLGIFIFTIVKLKINF